MVGCNGVNARAPALTPPPRPELVAVDPEQWRVIPADIRAVLTENQKKIHQYVSQLELLLRAYEDWRTTGSNDE